MNEIFPKVKDYRGILTYVQDPTLRRTVFDRRGANDSDDLLTKKYKNLDFFELDMKLIYQ